MLVCFVLPQQAAAQNPATDVMVSIDDASVGEGDGSVTLTARLSRAVNQDVLLGITYQDGTATVLDDLRRRPAPPRLVTILANTLSTNFSVLIRNDTSVEPVETLTVSLGGISLPPDTNFVFSGSRATLTIIDNDNPPPPVNNPVQITDPQPIPEGAGHLNFVVTTKFNVNSDVVLGVAYAGGTTNPATPADDLGSDRPLTVTIAEGERRTTLRVPIIDDNFIEGNETFTVALSLPADNPPGQTLHFDGGADTTTATGTIIDDADDTPVVNATVGIGNASVAENGGNAEFTVSLTPAVGSAVTLAVAYTAGTATLATDLGTRPDTVTITANTTEATLLVPIANDNIVEGNETFTVTISEGTTPLPEGVTIGTDDTGTGTITEDDEAEITLSTTTPTAAENGTFTYTVSLSNPADEAVTVRWTATDGTATVDDDLDEQTDTVTFNANDNTDQTFTIAVNDDDLDEDNETFTVTLEVDTEGGNALPTGVEIGTSNTATGTITDNDDPTGPDLTVDDVSVSSASVVEGVSFTINATVNNEGNAASAATTLTYYLSADATITTGDTSIATDPIGILAASGSSTQNASVSIATADTYYVGACVPTVSGETDTDNNCSTGVQVTVTVPAAPDLTVDSVSVSSASVVEGASFTINATVNNEGNAASAATTLTYYRSADATITTGDTSMATDPIGILAASGSSTQNASVSIATADTYYVGACVPTVSGETNTDNNCSTGVQVTVTAATVAPQITTQPTDQSVTVGENATFTVTATGTPTPTYQWRFEGSDISGATSASYTLSNAALTNAGDYTVVVTNTAGTVTSTAATLTVTPAAVAPQITTQPTDQSVTVGGSATFTVTATGTPTPTYQWRFEGSDIAGATSASYAISSVALTNAGDYTVVVTNTAGTVTSSAATLTVTAPDLTVDSVSVSSASVVEGASFTINATVNNEGNAASAATTLTYYRSTDATITTGDTSIATDPIAILAASGSSTQDASVSIATADTYYVGACVPTVSGETNTDNNCSTGVQVTVTAATVAPAITTQPTNQSVAVGGSATFTVAATGTPTPTYQWRKDGTAIVGATSASYTISSAALTDAGSYTVVVTSTAGTVTSTAATLTVTAAPVAPAITTQPANQSVAVGGSATFTVAATGTPTPTYQWRKDGSDIAEATSATYTLASAALTDAGSYSVVVTNTAGTVTSTAATLTVTVTAPDLTVDSVSVSSASVVEGASFTINATVNNEGNAASAATTLTYYRSADATITTDDTSIATDPIGTLAANGSSTQNASVSIATADTYYVGACVPTVSGETNTDNNCSTGVQVVVTAAPPPPTVNISIAPASAEEGNNIRFTVTLSTQLLEQRTLDVSYTAGTGDTGASLDDLGSDRPATLTLPATGMTINLDVPTVEDSDEEEDETFTVTLSLPDPLPDDPANTLTITTGTATGTITDDDTPDAEVSIGNASVAENGGNAEFTVSLTTAVDSAVTLAVAYTAGTATLATDLGTRPDTVTITADTTETTLLVPITNDNIVEGDEDFTVTISEGTTPLPDGVTIGTDDTGTGTITEDDAGEITLSTTTPTAAENGTFTYTVSLSAAADEAVTVRWTATDGTATVNNDLQETTNTVTFAANDNTAQEFTISPVNDTDDEDDETFTVTLSADTEGGNPLPTGVTIGTDNSSTATIIDNDDSPPPTLIDVSINDASAAEGTNIRFAVTLSAALIEAQTLNVAYTAGSASLDDLGSERPTTLTLPTGTISVNLEVPTVDDNLVEDSESFTVTLSAVPPGPEDPPPADTLFLSDPEATGTITDNDRTPADDAMVRIGDMTVGEAAGNAAFTVTLSRAVSSPVVLDVTYADGTAEVTTDLGTPLPPTVTIAADTTEATVAVPIVDDDRVEGAETFTVTVSENRDTELPDGVTIADGEATGTIADNDVVPPENDAQVRIGDVLVGEGAGPARLKVTLSRAVDSAVILDVTYADGSAAVPTDLGTPLLSTVTIAADTTEATIEVPIIDDDLVESVETFTVTLAEDPANPLPAGVSIGDDDEATATVSIVDDDRATVSIAPPTPSEDEGGVFNFTANLSTPVHEAVTVTWRAASGTARVSGDDSDLEASQDVTGTVVFAAGTDEPQTFSIATLDDLLVEGDETFTVTLSGRLPMRVHHGTRTATATIVDDDRATVSIAPPTPSEDEGGIFNFTVGLSQAATEEVSVTWTATSGTARVSGDDSDLGMSQDVTGTVVFAAGTDEDQAFSLATLNDTRVEGDEDFTVTLSGDLPSGVDFGTRTAIATIVDDDLATVDIEDAPPVAEDAGPARFRVTLNRELDRDVVLDVAYVAGSAELTDLGSPRPATVTIAAGGTEASLEVPIFDDKIVEGEETFTVILTGDTLPNGVTVADGVALGTIARTPELPEQSALIESRRSGAGTALRRHANRFDLMIGALVRNRLDGRRTRNLSGSKNLGDSPLSVGGGLSRELGDTHWGTWIDGAWAGLGGTATGQQADLYGGLDYRSATGRWLIGALAGYELADLDTGGADYRADFIQIGFYGGARLSERLLFDVAATYGMATPEIALGDISASYDARRFTARAALTGSFGLEYGLENGSLRIEPQLGVLYAREMLGAFTDSVGGVAGREVLELGRFNAGPRLTWEFEGGQMVGGIRLQSDVLKLQDGVDGRFSGAADIGLRLDLGPNFRMGFQLDIDGIGLKEDFGSLGGRIDLGIGFGSGPRTTQVQKRGTNEATSSDPEVLTTSDR